MQVQVNSCSFVSCSVAVDLQNKAEVGEAWLQLLKTHEYDHLTFEQRVGTLKTLVHMALDGPAVRATIEARIEESQRIRKQMFEEAKVRHAL